ncbi:MAG: SprT family zinc-dependent metalloprotease [Clostridiaceae bacterium]
MKYKIVRDNRRKKVAIKISNDNEILVLAPKNATKKQIELLVKTNENIIRDKVKEFNSLKINNGSEKSQLFLMGKKIKTQISYVKEAGNQLKYTGEEIQIYVFEKESDKEKAINEIIANWYKKIAKAYLSHMVQEKARVLGFNINNIRIKDVETIWGSCSSKGNINLNYRLIMMPERIISYVIIHELCHLKEMNHSKKFWTLVEGYDMNYKLHRNFLKTEGNMYRLLI